VRLFRGGVDALHLKRYRATGAAPQVRAARKLLRAELGW
jgi:hypothetical protein